MTDAQKKKQRLEEICVELDAMKAIAEIFDHLTPPQLAAVMLWLKDKYDSHPQFEMYETSESDSCFIPMRPKIWPRTSPFLGHAVVAYAAPGTSDDYNYPDLGGTISAIYAAPSPASNSIDVHGPMIPNNLTKKYSSRKP